MEIKIPSNVLELIHILEGEGYEAYIVGGCVRDSVLGIEPNDWDICTNSKPDDTLTLFESGGYKVIPTGLKHGTVTVVIDKEHFEITTYRVDGEYSDGRRPDQVAFTTSLEDDLARRDFTINAMAYNPTRGLIDPYSGLSDLRHNRIAAVGNSKKRYTEDALRMIRAIRFSSRYGFEIDDKSLESITENSELIRNVSKERIRDELCKILISDNPDKGVRLLQQTGLTKHFLSEIDETVGFEQHNPNHNTYVFDHILDVVKNTPRVLKIRLAALFHDIAKPRTFSLDDKGIGHFYNHAIVGMDMSLEIMARLKFDNQMISDVSILVKEHMNRHKNVKSMVAKKFINRVGVNNIYDLFDLMKADTLGSKPPHDYSDVEHLKMLCETVINEKQPLGIKDLAIDGKDLIEIGFKPSKEMGEFLSGLLELVLENPDKNKREELLHLAQDHLKC